MLFRFLSMGLMGLCSTSALAMPHPPPPPPGHGPGPHHPHHRPHWNVSQPQISNPRQVLLPYSFCSVDDADCSKKPDSYLTVNFAVEHGVLLANTDQIFPPATSMALHTVERRKSSDDLEYISLPYELGISPLPPRKGEESSPDALLIKLNLLNRPPSTDSVAIHLANGPEGQLLISDITIEPTHGPHHHHHHGPPKGPEAKSWRTQVNAYLIAMEKAAKGYLSSPAPAPKGSGDSSYQVAHYHTSHRGGDHRAFLRLMRPVVLPAILGIVAGIFACIFGFLVGRVVVSVYLCTKGRSSKRPAIPDIIVEDGTVSEKDSLMERDRQMNLE
ncbi:hypothetical protein ASPWEDRAFT_22283 [Aspergillus wentii DTO 134E9]|uniref:Uncharacterized protein n=1 Tax=Aspergillus wentii DTO 134E9 TaxID=1073089 RepID=A0A1L9RYX8_ASPWE|nr:uncharacterized protein ASPWEDRAFT_22283 [Aspergillus wentii DTO 134E9]KAI9932508.1 hypothetical protein MW887_008750 [Aspergillus wentii]OJJ40074.1 hypothetical protein ASPWEDRAFT_22283 [Aspergillus wentii DTO 134E9]